MWQPVAAVGPDFADAPPESMGLSFFLYPRGLGADAVTLVGHTGHQAGFAAFFVMNPRNGRAVIANFNTSHSEADRDAYGKSKSGLAQSSNRRSGLSNSKSHGQHISSPWLLLLAITHLRVHVVNLNRVNHYQCLSRRDMDESR